MNTNAAKTRVLLVIGSMHIGGAEHVVVNLAREMDPDRFEVGVCCTKSLGVLGERLRAESFPVFLAAPGARRLRHLTPLVLRRQVARFRADVVHTHDTPALLHAGPLGAVGLLPPWLHSFHHGNYPLKRRRQMQAERLLCRRADQLVAVSEHQRKTIIDCHGVGPEQIITVPNGVPRNPHLSNPAVRARVRAEFRFASDDLVVGAVAVLSEQKGITYLLQAVPAITAANPKVRILIAGGGPLEASLRAEAAARGLSSTVVFTGWRQDNLEILTALDVFVMSSLWEAMPMALLEAMATRRPIVVTDVGSNRGIVDDGRCGVLVPPRDAGAIANAVTSLAARPKAAADMADLAYRRFDQRFTTRAMAATYERLYGQLLGRRGAGEPRALQEA